VKWRGFRDSKYGNGNLLTGRRRTPIRRFARLGEQVTAVPAQQVEEMLAKVFPDLKGKVLTFATLASDAEVDEFERLLSTRQVP
jgi:hypothetical protein